MAPHLPSHGPDAPTRRLLARIGLWLAVAGGLSLALAAVLAVIDVRGVPLLTHVAHAPILADPHLTRRLADADASGPVDVLVVGSSHAYREIDPSAFAARGLRAFNLGSSAQTPVLTHALLDRYLPRLRPRLVVVETYPVTLDGDGAEGVYGLIASAPVDGTALRLALRLHTPTVALALVGASARRALHRPTGRADGTYVADGFVQRADTMRFTPAALRRFPTTVELDDAELADLGRLAGRIEATGARVVFVEMPITAPLRAYVRGYDDASRAVEGRADALGVPFLRVGDWPLGVRDNVDFYDPDHLNAAGNTRVLPALLDTLAARGLLPPVQ